MAQAIISSLRQQLPELNVAFTFFSPSAERIAQRVGADVAGYLPIDSRANMRELVQQLKPDVVAFVRTEIWPMLGIEAVRRGAKAALVNAVLGPQSSRIRAPARYMLGPAYRRLDAIGAVAAEDAQRFQLFDIAADRIHVTGDARFDQVATRIAQLDLNSPLLLRLRTERPVLVAGSTWPADERLLISAITALPAEHRPVTIIAPHEPSDAHLAAIEQLLEGRRFRRLGELERNNDPLPEFVIVDRVGVLADLYALAAVAYVGGGFGGAGLHSVVEPAALGVPVIYGPRHGNAREAEDLAAAGGGTIVDNSAAAAAALHALLTDAARRTNAGAAARSFVDTRRGAAYRNAALVASLL